MNNRLLFLILFLFISTWAHPQISPDTDNILYVNKSVSAGSEAGNSWKNAIPELADALKWAKQNENNWTESVDSLQIYVAKGTYKPLYSPEDENFGNDASRLNTFLMVHNVQLYGGFDPDNGVKNITDSRILSGSLSIGGGSILSGDVNDDDGADFANNLENSYHIVVSSGAVGTAVLNGFSITGGWAQGGAEYISVNGNEMSADRGAGVYNSYSSPRLINVALNGNKSKSYGAGIWNDTSSPLLLNVTLSANTSGYSGGGMYNYNSSPTLTNVTVSGNTALKSSGGGIYNFATCSPNLTNCIVWNNAGGGISGSLTTGAKPTLSYSLVQGVDNTANNGLDGKKANNAPQFTDAANGDFSIQNHSSVINAGSNAAYSAAGGNLDTDVDLAGNSRVDTEIIDIGAYEFQLAPIAPSTDNIIFVDKKITNGNGSGDSWINATSKLAYALKYANENQEDWSATIDSLQIYVAKGTYKPFYSAVDESFGNPNGRDNSFLMVKNAQLYGGFDPATGIVDLTNDRILPSLEGTILSGDTYGDDGADFDNNDENVYHVVVSAQSAGSAKLDGFYITGGNANVDGFTYVNGEFISTGDGGGIHIKEGSPRINNVTVIANNARYGGGMHLVGASPDLTHIALIGNNAGHGGGMIISSSSPSLTYVTIVENTSNNYGGG